jgi:hypothetical protein
MLVFDFLVFALLLLVLWGAGSESYSSFEFIFCGLFNQKIKQQNRYSHHWTLTKFVNCYVKRIT